MNVGVLESKKQVTLADGYLLDTYTAVAAYDLFKLKTTATKSIEVRRSSDNALTDVLLEDTGSLTLSSIVSAGGTLGDWIGLNSAFIRTWYDQSGNSKDIIQTVNGSQPRIINAGALEVKNALAALRFLGNSKLSGPALTALNSGNSFTIYAASSSTSTETLGSLINTSASIGFRFAVFRDSRATVGLRNAIIQKDNTLSYYSNLSQARNNTNTLLQTVIVSPNLIDGWDNGVGGSGAVITEPSSVYVNDTFTVGVQFNDLNFLDGTIQAIIIRAQVDNDTTRQAIESNINSSYGIY